MNTKRKSKLPAVIRQLRHLIHADTKQALLRRELSDAAQGEVQLELDLSPHGKVR